MLGTEPRRLERYAPNLQRRTRAPDHGPLHRRWVANRTADATSIRPEILRSVRQIDSLALENPSISVPIGHSISRAELPSTTQNWQHCTDVFGQGGGAFRTVECDTSRPPPPPPPPPR